MLGHLSDPTTRLGVEFTNRNSLHVTQKRFGVNFPRLDLLQSRRCAFAVETSFSLKVPHFPFALFGQFSYRSVDSWIRPIMQPAGGFSPRRSGSLPTAAIRAPRCRRSSTRRVLRSRRFIITSKAKRD